MGAPSGMGVAVLLIVVAGGLVAVVDAAWHQARWEAIIRGRSWPRVLAWIGSLTAAGALGGLLGGSSDVVVVAVAAGLMALLLMWRLRDLDTNLRP